MNEQMTAMLRRWREFVKTEDAAILDEILSDEVNFHSPFVWKPKAGKAVTKKYLTAAAEVLGDFRYIREVCGETDCVLEFEAVVGGLTVRGVDLIKLNEAGKITDFEVMARPANGLQMLGAEMSRKLGL